MLRFLTYSGSRKIRLCRLRLFFLWMVLNEIVYFRSISGQLPVHLWHAACHGTRFINYDITLQKCSFYQLTVFSSVFGFESLESVVSSSELKIDDRNSESEFRTKTEDIFWKKNIKPANKIKTPIEIAISIIFNFISFYFPFHKRKYKKTSFEPFDLLIIILLEA